MEELDPTTQQDAATSDGSASANVVNSDPKPVQTESKRSDAEVRISSLQSQLDRLRTELGQAKTALQSKDADFSKAVSDRLASQKDLEELAKKVDGVVNTASLATQDALDIAKTKSEENATLRGVQAKLEFLIHNPQYVPFADVIPATANEEDLKKITASIDKARELDKQSFIAQVQGGANVQATNLTRVAAAPTDPASIRAYLAGSENPKQREERLQEILSKLEAIKKEAK